MNRLRILWFVLSLLLMLGSTTSFAQVKERLTSPVGRVFFSKASDNIYSLRSWIHSGDASKADNPRLVAIALDVTLGLLGMHRLYLGTDLKVPIFYTLTLGGGGVLWVVDLGMLIFSKDIEPFMDNPRLFMWAK